MKYDVVIIGSGPGGYVAAIRAAQLGLKVAIVERWKLGGVCLNVGCIPTKALLHASHIYHEAKNGEKYGIKGSLELDIAKTNKWKEGVVDKLVKGVEFLLKNQKVEIFYGEGFVERPNEVKVKTNKGVETLETKNIIIATGSRIRELKGFEADGKLIWNSDHAVSFPEIPESLLVVGAGAVGLEFAQFYKMVGSKRVVVIDIADQIVPGMDGEMARYYQRVLKKGGLEFYLRATLKDVSEDGTAVFVSEGKEYRERFDKILVAIGRIPNSEGFKHLGINMDEKGFIKTDDRMETNVKGIYAIGDVSGPPLLAHKASKEGIVAVENIAGLYSRASWRGIPSVIYTYPEFASVGFGEEQAKELGYNVKVGRFPLSASGRALTMGGVDGLAKVVVDADTDEILGVHIIAPEASSLIAEATLALEVMASAEDIDLTIHPHPTISEILMEAAGNVHKRAIHIIN
ncbi:MAG: dihydrolipoyl dehydrogenase [candidate division WOR-3 bacterium]